MLLKRECSERLKVNKEIQELRKELASLDSPQATRGAPKVTIKDLRKMVRYVACINEFQLRAVHSSSKENRLSDLLSRWHLNENNERLFYTESGLSPHDEIFITDHLFKFENQW